MNTNHELATMTAKVLSTNSPAIRKGYRDQAVAIWRTMEPTATIEELDMWAAFLDAEFAMLAAGR